MESDDVDSGGFGEQPKKPRELPADLPTSLDDRRAVRDTLVRETEYYDGWQGWFDRTRCTTVLCCHRRLTFGYLGESQFLTSPVLAKPLEFSELTLDDPNYDTELTKGRADTDTRLQEMLAAQAQHHGGDGLVDLDSVLTDEKLDEAEKKKIIQKAFAMAASNGDITEVKKILGGKAKDFVDVNAPDDDGTPPLVYASCFVSHTLLKTSTVVGLMRLTDSL
jgi:hypothetical protein